MYLVASRAELGEDVLEHLELAGRAEHLCRSGQKMMVKPQRSNATLRQVVPRDMGGSYSLRIKVDTIPQKKVPVARCVAEPLANLVRKGI